MAGHSSAFANKFLLLFFNGTAIANIADNAASSPLTNLYVALHTADPGASGNQTTSECAYTSYARVAVARTSGGWVISGITLSPAADIVFPTCTGGSEVAKFFTIGTGSTGAGNVLYYGPLSTSIAISSSVVPKIKAASSITEN